MEAQAIPDNQSQAGDGSCKESGSFLEGTSCLSSIRALVKAILLSRICVTILGTLSGVRLPLVLWTSIVSPWSPWNTYRWPLGSPIFASPNHFSHFTCRLTGITSSRPPLVGILTHCIHFIFPMPATRLSEQIIFKPKDLLSFVLVFVYSLLYDF